MATLQINCPECDKEIKAPEEAIGKKIRCKGCEHVFVVARPKGKAGPAKSAKPTKPSKPAKEASKPAKEGIKPAKKDDDDDDEGGYGLTDYDASYRCPDCANPMESEDAVVCLHCGFNTKTRTKPHRRKVKEVTGGDKFLWLAPGILAAISIPVMLGDRALHHWVFPSSLPDFGDEWDKNMAETNSRFETVDKMSGFCCIEYAFHPAIELWMVIMTLFFCFFAARFAVKRLFINNTPPEVEVK